MTIQTVTIPERTFDVLDRPYTVTEALANMDADGIVAATVAVPVDQMVDPEHDYDTLYERLCARLVDKVPPFALSYEIVGISEDSAHLYVRVTQDMGSLLEQSRDEHYFAQVTPEAIEDALSRIVH